MEQVLAEAQAAVEHAQAVRSYHRRRTERDSVQRETDLVLALERIKAAMQPIRAEIGRFPYGAQTTLAEQQRQEIRDASLALQAERRKLWKMLPRKD